VTVRWPGVLEDSSAPTSSAQVRLATRGSALARWQAQHVAVLLRAAWPALRLDVQVLTTRGDLVLDTPLPLVGGKGLFTAELEDALRNGVADVAVHSLKDLPLESSAGLALGATPRRGNPADALVSRAGHTLESLPRGATVGTSSRRRAAQLRYCRPDLRIVDIRGNVGTRLRKVLDADSGFDAIVLASAGLERLGYLHAVSQVFSVHHLMPAPGQGALAAQCRDDDASLALLAPIDDADTATCVAAERAFLAGLGGGCSAPIAAYATCDKARLRLHGRVLAGDGSAQIDVCAAATLGTRLDEDLTAARDLGRGLAETALAQGAAALLGDTA
jgi:hydroxymethylbilane synthase